MSCYMKLKRLSRIEWTLEIKHSQNEVKTKSLKMSFMFYDHSYRIILSQLAGKRTNYWSINTMKKETFALTVKKMWIDLDNIFLMHWPNNMPTSQIWNKLLMINMWLITKTSWLYMKKETNMFSRCNRWKIWARW